MCGIAGELSFDSPVDPRILRGMTDALIHRGPDDQGLHCEGRIGLGHRRLSILDLSPTGHQPMWTRDRSLAIVFNGEVYNYREIRPELVARGYRFDGESDTEVVINAIHCWGLEAALHRFIGMFAFAVWDTRSRSLILVRDRIGVKPLYLQKTQKRLLFGSELKALYAHPSFQRDLLPKGLGQFFCFGFTLGETTVFKDTYKLPAGHYLHISESGETKLSRYWSIDAVERGSFCGTFAEATEHLTELCDSAFSYRLVSDVPVSVFLSGGIDSTFLAAFLKKRLGADLDHFTIGFTDTVYDEAPKATQVAHDLDLLHTVKTIDASEAKDALFRFVEIWDEPFGDTSGIPTSILCGLASQQTKVALSADGGDELFCGYESYGAYDSRYQHLQQFPLPLRKVAASVLRCLPYHSLISVWLYFHKANRRRSTMIRQYEKFLDLLSTTNLCSLAQVSYEKFSPNSLPFQCNLTGSELVESTMFDASVRNMSVTSPIDYLMRTDLDLFLVDDVLAKVDRASMAVSLETRDPFLDHRLIEFAFSLPLDFLYRDGVHKYILKVLMKNIVSPQVLSAPKKGFSIPLGDWIRGPWKPLVYEYLSPSIVRKVGVLDEDSVARELKLFYCRFGGSPEKIMLMLNFQMWAMRWYIG